MISRLEYEKAADYLRVLFVHTGESRVLPRRTARGARIRQRFRRVHLEHLRVREAPVRHRLHLADTRLRCVERETQLVQEDAQVVKL